MRKFLISAAVAATALAAAAPAAAQWAPPQPQGYGYGHHDNYGQVRRLQVRIDHIQRQIRQLDRRNIITNREAARLMDDSRDLERRLHRSARFGLTGQERYAVERRLVTLERRLWRDARDGNRWGDRGWNDRDRDGRGWNDRDHDGRDDRWARRDRDDD